ncbi:MAG TPA: NAD(P)-dependent oxidoreductase [Gaiellaceae bacterium]|nr:NAD(P)-dependent oxidoreductase [Gaiellaceae bacterium]
MAADVLVVTGCSGRVAAMIAPHLRSRFHLRGLDIEVPDGDVVDEFVNADVREIDAVGAALSGAVAVLHLAGQPADADFRERLLPRNLDGTWATFEAAVRAGTPRFVFASSLQTIQGYEPEVAVPANAAPRPKTVYGSTKVFGEALGRFHADTSALGVACLRMGAVRTADSADLRDSGLPQIWLGSQDLARLVVAAVDSSVAYAIVTAVSPPATERFDTANPFGWTPTELPARL